MPPLRVLQVVLCGYSVVANRLCVNVDTNDLRNRIMTGTDHHIAGLGNLLEWTNRSDQYVLLRMHKPSFYSI